VYVLDGEVVFINQETALELTGSLDKIPSHAHEWRWGDFSIYCLYGDNSYDDKEKAWNTQFIGDGFFDVIDGVIITYSQGSGLYPIAVVADQKTADAFKAKFGDIVIILADDLDFIVSNPAGTPNGNLGYWFNEYYPGVSGGGIAYLIEVYQWQ
jgi:hypothetical protein